MAHNVFIKRQVAAFNVDSLNRSAIVAADIDNGTPIQLTTRVGLSLWNGQAFTSAHPAEVWVAAAPEVNYATKTKSESSDPRDFYNVSGKAFDVIRLTENDIVEMTGEGQTTLFPATADYAYVTPNGWTGTGSAPTSGIYLHKIGTDLLHVGDGAIAPVGVTTYIYEVKKA